MDVRLQMFTDVRWVGFHPLKNEQHLNIDYNFDHQLSLSKSKCWYSNSCLHFLKRAVPFKSKILK